MGKDWWNTDWDCYERLPVPRAVGLVNPNVYVSKCVCGGEIVAMRTTEDELIRAISEEQDTPQHRRWRWAKEVGTE